MHAANTGITTRSRFIDKLKILDEQRLHQLLAGCSLSNVLNEPEYFHNSLTPNAPVTTKVFCVRKKIGLNGAAFVVQARYRESQPSFTINSGKRKKCRTIQEGDRWKFVPLL